MVSDQQEKQLREGWLSCLQLDGRIDETKVKLELEGINRKFPDLTKEEHCAVCSESGIQVFFILHLKPKWKRRNMHR